MPRVTSTNKLLSRCFKALIPALSFGRGSRGLERRRRDAEITLAPVTHDGASELKPAIAVCVSNYLGWDYQKIQSQPPFPDITSHHRYHPPPIALGNRLNSPHSHLRK